MAQCACGLVIYYLSGCVCVEVVILTGYDCVDAFCIVLRVRAFVRVQVA